MKKLALFGAALVAGLFISGAARAEGGMTLVVQMFGQGTTVGTLDQVAAEQGIDLGNRDLGFAYSEFQCHTMPLIDPATKLRLGSGIDCLANIQEDGNGGLTLTAVSFFVLPSGTLASTGQTSLAAFINNFGDASGSDSARTHISGAVPSGYNIIGATGQFAGMKGKARLSGTMRIGDTLFFDCIFVLDLESA